MELRDHKNFFIDLGKTLIRWNSTVIGAEDLVDSLRESGKNVYFHTDNTLLTRKGYAKKLTSLGIPAQKEEILTSGYVAGRKLAEENVSEAYIAGESGLIEELEEQDVNFSEEAKTAVVGFDRQFNYRKLRRLMKIIEDGEVYTCSSEKTFQTSKHVVPHQGPFNASIHEFGEPALVGKPSETFRKVFEDYFNFFPEKSIFIGDRLADIETGNKMGMTTAAVMSGDIDEEVLKNAEDIQKPDYGISSLHKLRRRII